MRARKLVSREWSRNLGPDLGISCNSSRLFFNQLTILLIVTMSGCTDSLKILSFFPNYWNTLKRSISLIYSSLLASYKSNAIWCKRSLFFIIDSIWDWKSVRATCVEKSNMWLILSAIWSPYLLVRCPFSRACLSLQALCTSASRHTSEKC